MVSNSWKKLKGYNDRYEINLFGKIRNSKGLIMKTKINKDGYEQVPLMEDGKKKQRLVHRLVGITFIDNPDFLPLINHKDENKLNNYYENLEWCDYTYNNNYGNRNKTISAIMKNKTHWENNINSPMKIKQICRETGKVIETFNSMREASKATNITVQTIRRTANKVYKNSRCKFDWEYEN